VQNSYVWSLDLAEIGSVDASRTRAYQIDIEKPGVRVSHLTAGFFCAPAGVELILFAKNPCSNRFGWIL
jgi:hypothetical protein